MMTSYTKFRHAKHIFDGILLLMSIHHIWEYNIFTLKTEKLVHKNVISAGISCLFAFSERLSALVLFLCIVLMDFDQSVTEIYQVGTMWVANWTSLLLTVLGAIDFLGFVGCFQYC